MSGIKWTEEENQILKDNYNVLSIENLVMLFPTRTEYAVKRKASFLKLTSKAPDSWTKAELELLKSNYSSVNIKNVFKLFPDRTENAVKRKATKLKLKAKKKLNFNENIFETPNNINSFYAGFIAADGCISDNNQLKIELQKTDKNFLEKFNTFMECSRCVRDYTREKLVKKQHSVIVNYTSKKLADDLKTNFLLKPRKTLNCLFPKHLSLNNKLSYVVGNLDGDGSILKGKYSSFTVSWLGDFKFLTHVRSLFFRLGWIKNKTKYLHKITESGLYSLIFSGKIAKFIYRMLMIHIEKHDLPVMERKWFNKGVGYISLKRIAEREKLKAN